MSQDEMLFDEVKYREPVRTRRPDRDRRWACLAYEVADSSDLPIYLDYATADAIERHALRDTSVELGGILLGKECLDDQTGEPFVWVTQGLEAKHYENTQASFTYTHDSWEEITRERDRLHPDLDIVGWYHTHPDFGVFLSSHDMFIHRHFFGQPLQLAYVVDPIRQTRGFFRWHGGEMAQVGGFTLTADRGDRQALARLANDLERIPNAAGSGGSLSPRLEAELIAMLSRPAAHFAPAVAADRAQTALIFALLGSMLGVVGLAAALWLNTLNGSVQEQTRVLLDVRKDIETAADHQRVALDAAIGDSKGANPERFLKDYARATRERDLARRQLDSQLEANDLLALRSREIGKDFLALQSKFELAKTFEKDAKLTGELQTQVRDLQVKVDGQKTSIAHYEELLETPEGRKALGISVKYQNAWYAAVAGWTAAGIIALATVGYHFFQKLPHEEGLAPSSGGVEPPPHHIA